MLAYASHRPVVVERRSAPHAMLAIIAGHVALLAAVMSAKMDLPQRITHSPLVVDLIREDDPPPPNPDIQPKLPTRPQPSTLDQPMPLVPTPTPSRENVDSTPSPIPDFDRLIGPSLPHLDPVPTPAPILSGARLLTPAYELKPPYPASKLASGEEALLRLKLTIDERGRVIAVEAVGPADRTFLGAARRHLMAHWHYRPASEGGRPVASTAVIALRFQLEG